MSGALDMKFQTSRWYQFGRPAGSALNCGTRDRRQDPVRLPHERIGLADCEKGDSPMPSEVVKSAGTGAFAGTAIWAGGLFKLRRYRQRSAVAVQSAFYQAAPATTTPR
jgi:hypothetical protein